MQKISKVEILTILKDWSEPIPFETIYDSLWVEPDPIVLQTTLTEMVTEGKIRKSTDDYDRIVYDIPDQSP